MNEGVEKGKELKRAAFDIQVTKGQLKYDILTGPPDDAKGRLAYYMKIKSAKQKLQNTKKKISNILRNL